MRKFLITGAIALSSLAFANTSDVKTLDKSTNEVKENIQQSNTEEAFKALLFRFLSVTFTSTSCSGPVTVTYESTAAEGSAEYLDDLASAINYADLHHCYGDGADTFLLLK